LKISQHQISSNFKVFLYNTCIDQLIVYWRHFV